MFNNNNIKKVQKKYKENYPSNFFRIEISQHPSKAVTAQHKKKIHIIIHFQSPWWVDLFFSIIIFLPSSQKKIKIKFIHSSVTWVWLTSRKKRVNNTKSHHKILKIQQGRIRIFWEDCWKMVFCCCCCWFCE